MENNKPTTLAACRREYLKKIANSSEALLDTIETAWTHWYPPEYGSMADTLGTLQANLQRSLREVKKRLEIEEKAA